MYPNASQLNCLQAFVIHLHKSIKILLCRISLQNETQRRKRQSLRRLKGPYLRVLHAQQARLTTTFAQKGPTLQA